MYAFVTWIFSATEYHLGLLKAKLAKYRAQLMEPSGKIGAKVCLNMTAHIIKVLLLVDAK